MRDAFIRLYREELRRPGADKLLAWLDTTDFFTAPASTRFHGAHEGGLVEHSVNVYRRLERLMNLEYGDDWIYPAESVALCGLLHDVCKAGFYEVSARNVKNEETGKWEKQPYYTVHDRFPYGHGEKSAFLIERFVRLSTDEALAIRWHMGGFDAAARGGDYGLSGALESCPLALLLHLADMQATYLDEVRDDAG